MRRTAVDSVLRQRFFLVFNPSAGRSRGAAVDQLVQALEAAGGTVTRGAATSPEIARHEAHKAALSGHFDALVACGGDGTVRQIASAAAGTSCPVGAFMLGTGNVLAHDLALPRDPAAMADLLRTGTTCQVQLGLANSDPFLLMAGVGFDGRVIGHLDQRLKRFISKAAFVPATLQALSAPIDDLRVDVDGRCYDGVAWVIVTNARHYGGAFRLTARTHLRQDGLVAVLLYAKGKADLIRHNVAIARSSLDDRFSQADPHIDMIDCREVHVTSARAVPVQIDGDSAGVTPLHVTAQGPRVSLIVPADHVP